MLVLAVWRLKIDEASMAVMVILGKGETQRWRMRDATKTTLWPERVGHPPC